MTYLNALNVFKFNMLSKNKYFYYHLNNKNTIILNKLLELNLISYIVKVKDKPYYKIGISYTNNEPICKDIQILYRSSKPRHVNLETLNKIKKFKYNSIYLMFTNKGLITNLDAVNYNIGGVLFCKITI